MSIINIGLTGLKAHQAALAVTGNNVTNANTEGYTRQRVEMAESRSQYIGAGYLGTGVSITDIKRLTDQYLTDQVRIDQSIYSNVEKLRVNVAQIDSLLADATTGLSPAMSSFFSALQSAADDPSSVPERQLVLTQAQGLVNRFGVLYNRLDSQARTVDQDIRAQVTRINSLANGLAQVNLAISSSQGNAQGKSPNDLMDQREKILRDLSEIVSVTAIPGVEGQINVLIGNGQSLVVGNRANVLTVEKSEEDPTRLDIRVSENGQQTNITSQITGGGLGGVLKFRDEILREALNSMGRIAFVLADTINQQHQLGVDLEGNLGKNFFDDINSEDNQIARVFAHEGNALPNDRRLLAEVIESSELTTRDYTVQFTGPSSTDVLVTDAYTGEKITRGKLTSYLPAYLEFDGLRLRFESGSFQTGDSFQVSPTRFGARDVAMNLTRVEEIALGSPVRTDTDLGNIGNARITPGELLDVRSPITGGLLPAFALPGQMTPPILVRFINDDYYEVLDNSDPSNPVALVPPMNNQKYIQGITNQIFTDEPGMTGLSALGTTVGQVPASSATPTSNGYLAQNLTIQVRDLETGIVTQQPTLAIADDASAEDIAAALKSRNGIDAWAYTEATITNFTDDGSGTAPTLRINGQLLTLPVGGTFSADDIAEAINGDSTLKDLKITAKSDGTTVTLRSFTGKDLKIEVIGSAGDTVDVDTARGSPITIPGGEGTQIGGQIEVRLQEGVRLTADNNNIFQQAPVAVSAYTGYTAGISGTPKKGDQFTIDYNTEGTSDNRNALSMAGLETTGTVGAEVSTYNEAYSQLVEVVGSVASQAEIDSQSSKSLLTQSENRWQEMSGVNLDEEAGKLIQFQAAYNASAQVVSIARQLFDTLLSTFR